MAGRSSPKLTSASSRARETPARAEIGDDGLRPLAAEPLVVGARSPAHRHSRRPGSRAQGTAASSPPVDPRTVTRGGAQRRAVEVERDLGGHLPDEARADGGEGVLGDVGRPVVRRRGAELRAERAADRRAGRALERRGAGAGRAGCGEEQRGGFVRGSGGRRISLERIHRSRRSSAAARPPPPRRSGSAAARSRRRGRGPPRSGSGHCRSARGVGGGRGWASRDGAVTRITSSVCWRW